MHEHPCAKPCMRYSGWNSFCTTLQSPNTGNGTGFAILCGACFPASTTRFGSHFCLLRGFLMLAQAVFLRGFLMLASFCLSSSSSFKPYNLKSSILKPKPWQALHACFVLVSRKLDGNGRRHPTLQHSRS